MGTQAKQFFTGTHRAVSPDDTWARVQPVLPMVGVSRVADITDLDTCGIPVAVAIRPTAATLAVSAGKGVSRLLAKVGAAMESVEIWHAEQAGPASRTASTVEAGVPYPLDALQLARGSVLTPYTPIEWMTGRTVISGVPVPVPRALVRLSSVVTDRWKPPMFLETSNGLASGNTYAEAVQHALLELVERQCLLDFHNSPGSAAPVQLAAIEFPEVADLLDRLHRSGNLVRILDVTGAMGIPCYQAEIRNEAIPFTFAGAGCHTATEVALCRAVTEAAQSRLGAIAGSRDDLDDAFYRMADDPARRRGTHIPFTDHDGEPRPPRPGVAGPTFEADIALLVDRITAVTGHEPVVVDLTAPPCEVPVVKVIAPGLGFDGRSSFRPGPTGAAGDAS